ncbi:hypothetical protein BDN72DRAFT_783800 [Pluteus cervinus]|uniref:Uncharacterized protein n=1 Tax=Pluteus cervinus TaxID=181527 RepID=A0ACD3BHG1_9AGAR|nr:hypothetical protein BDN72DRAFT_783800 [Pluteus cervinus]
MIAGLSKAVTLYLSPLLALTAIFLTLFTYISPTLMLHEQVALLTVTPSLSLIQDGPQEDVDGPSLFLGVLGSCSRTSNNGSVTCTSVSINPTYNTSALPKNAPNLLLSAPTTATPAFIALAIFLSVLFFITFTAISFRHKMSAKLAATLDKPALQRFSAWIGFFGFLIGITSFLIVRMWFGKAVQDFNNTIMVLGQEGPKLVANLSNGFTMVWVGYAFYAVPVIISLSKLNVQASK